MADFRDTLVLPFQDGILPYPAPGKPWAFLNAVPLSTVDFDWRGSLVCEQRNFNVHCELEQAKFRSSAKWEAERIGGGIVALHQSRQVNEHNLARIWNNAEPGAPVICVSTKKQGVQSLRKRVGQRVEIAGSLSKNHAVVFWVIRSGPAWDVEEFELDDDTYVREPGVFSADGPDAGSQMLVSFFDDHIKGDVADLGAGWGYLSCELLKRSEDVQSLSLFDNDWPSLQSAQLNLGSSKVKSEFHWCDVPSLTAARLFDWVLMNPPFHTGRETDPQLGQKFINSAAKILKSRGRLLMVANRQLPYERVLDEHFSKVIKLEEREGFKVIEAIRR